MTAKNIEGDAFRKVSHIYDIRIISKRNVLAVVNYHLLALCLKISDLNGKMLEID